jgi:hypothetical protein
MTDGGLETTLIFHDGFDLPEFAAVDLLRSEEGIEALRSYYARYAELARELGMGLCSRARRGGRVRPGRRALVTPSTSSTR